MKDTEWQIIAARRDPIVWTGDPNDDCTARWAGLLLRAEEMDRNFWWWAVTDEERGIDVDSSHETKETAKNGNLARSFAEKAARKYLGILDT